MAESTGKTGRGVQFLMGDGESPEAFSAVANLVSTGITGRTAEEIDFTHLGSTGGFRELRQGFKDPGTIPLELHFNPGESTHASLLTKFLSGALFNWEINYSAAGLAYKEIGRGFVQNPGDVNINPNDPMGGTATVRISGATSIVAA